MDDRRPAAESWVVRRRWLPRTPTWAGFGFRRWRGRRSEASDGWVDAIPDPSGCADTPGMALAIIGVIAVAVLLWFAVLPALFFLADLLLLLVLAAGGVAFRILFRRPWLVVAARGDLIHEWAVVGFRASSRLIDRLRATLDAENDVDGIDLADFPTAHQLPDPT